MGKNEMDKLVTKCFSFEKNENEILKNCNSKDNNLS